MALRVGRQCHVHDGLRRRVETAQDGLAHFGWQLVAQRRDHAADFVAGLDHVLGERELDPERGIALVGAGIHVHCAGHGLQSLFQPVDDFALDRVGRGAGVEHVDLHARHFDVRVLVDAQLGQGQQAQRHHGDDQHDRGDRLLDTEVGQKHAYFPSAAAGAEAGWIGRETASSTVWPSLKLELGVRITTSPEARPLLTS